MSHEANRRCQARNPGREFFATSVLGDSTGAWGKCKQAVKKRTKPKSQLNAKEESTMARKAMVFTMIWLVLACFIGPRARAASDPVVKVPGSREDALGATVRSVFEKLDRDGAIRQAVDPQVRVMIDSRLAEAFASTGDPTVLQLRSAEVVRQIAIDLAVSGDLDRVDRPAVAAYLRLAVWQGLADAGFVSDPTGAPPPLPSSPIGDFCKCDKDGSRDCGCRVNQTGDGGCEYTVSCGSLGRAFCSALNFEACAVTWWHHIGVPPVELPSDVAE